MKHHHRIAVSFVTLTLAFFCGLSVIANAQEITGSIVGTVKDSAGGIVTGATVTITDSAKKVQIRTITADDQGQFSAPNLESALYDVTVEAPSFKKHISTGVK